MDFDEANHALSVVASPQRKKGDDPAANARPVEVEFRRAMRSALLPRSSGGGRRSSGGADSPRSPPHSASKIFRFGAEVQNRPDRFRSALEVIADPRQEPGNDARTAALARPVPTKPSRILDAPDIVDDYYLNLLSWSSSNVLAVALANNVYLWNAATNEVSELLQLEQGDCVTSVSWAPGGSHLCVGTDSAAVQLWDASRMALVRSMRGHTARVGSLAWNPVFCGVPLFLPSLSLSLRGDGVDATSTDAAPAPGARLPEITPSTRRRCDVTQVSRCVNSGSRDALVLQHDARARQHRTATLVGHQQEVCGLSWSADGATLASGGNENYLCLWDAARSGQAQPSECAPRAIMRQHQVPFQRPSSRPLSSSGCLPDGRRRRRGAAGRHRRRRRRR